MSKLHHRVRNLRKIYYGPTLDTRSAPSDPMALFSRWLREALRRSKGEPHAMTLSTTDHRGRPSARLVLLRGIDAHGFVFYTNYQSRKAAEIAGNPSASLVFYWPEIERQVRIEGTLKKVSTRQSDAYFNTRPYGHQIGAWASKQSAIIADRKVLELRVRALMKEFPEGSVPRPPHWGGYLLKPRSIEFWSGRPDRLHDRVLYKKRSRGWSKVRLSP